MVLEAGTELDFVRRSILGLKYVFSFLGSTLGFLFVTKSDVALHELAELILMLFSSLHKLMLKKGLSRGPLLRVLDQALPDEVLELSGPSTINWRRRLFDYIKDYSVLWLIDIGRIAISHLHGEDPQAPNINTRLVSSLSLDQFGSHPAHSTDLTRTSIPLLRQLS